MTLEEKIRGRRVGILGMARSGVASAILAKRKGGKPFVSDNARAELLSEPIARLQKAGIEFEVGGHTDRLLGCDYIVVSPGVPLTMEMLKRARAANIPIFSELEFAAWFCAGQIVAITGTNGKTTTTSLTGEIFKAAGVPTYVCGNIGVAFTDIADQVPSNGVAVVEVSSFQLETVADFRPKACVILNITPDHLDRHGSMDGYKRVKYRITENQGPEDYFIVNRDDEILMTDPAQTQATRLQFSIKDDIAANTFVRDGALWIRFKGRETKVIATDEITIQGPHNLQNAAAAVSLAMTLDIPVSAMAQALKSFPGVEHRLEKAGVVAGITFINDSKATNVDSVVVAIRSMRTPTYLIMGGRHKGAPYTPIIEVGKPMIQGVIAIGESREKIFNDLGKAFPVSFAATLEEAVHKGFEMAHPGETVLLSPGCSSFDMFENFEHRGRVFKETVASLRNGKKKSESVGR
ncbi:MAG: UDP-N-acetylmuramoyl-L-alanine--D-glutamate ligase [bacterium]|nr:UDP-N-acetylmuramoyl-L-alanine--D-glutamate ligase [bacterium]